MELCIGTAQFGQNYGFVNEYKKVRREESIKILKLSAQHGVRFVDTAANYGDAERIIGDLEKEKIELEIITKIPHFQNQMISNYDAANVLKSAKNSCFNLRRETIYGIMLHNGADILKPGGENLRAMYELKNDGYVKKIGVSLYERAEIEQITKNFQLDIVQVPVSIFDQRLLSDDILVRLYDKGIEVDVRSVFFQGIILMDPEKVPAYFKGSMKKIFEFREVLLKHNLTPLEASLSFIKKLKFVSRVVLGVNNVTQLNEIFAAYNSNRCLENYTKYAFDEIDVLNPAKWGF